MPQLMPLSWMFSSLCLFFFVMMGCFLYSEMMFSGAPEHYTKIGGVSLWCW